MKRAFLSLLLLAPCIAAAQVNLTINSVDPSAYQDVRVLFTATDNAAKRILSFQPTDFTVVENGITRPVKSVSCPAPITPLQSVTITMDISYSMSIANRLVYAKKSAQSLVRSLQIPPGRVGITAFDDNSAIRLAHSTDTAAIQSTLASIAATGGGTDFYGAFMDPTTGAIDFTKNAEGLRYIIFITDAFQSISSSGEATIISAAKAAGIKIYTLTMSANTLNYSLRRIATQTGGQWYEDVTSEAQSDLIFSIIREQIIVYPPCELVYTTSGCDEARDLTLTVRKNNGTATRSKSFTVPANLISTLIINRALVDFGLVTPGNPSQRDIVITATNGDMVVQSITPMLSVFRVVDYGGSAPPFPLKAGESRTIRVEFAPVGTGRTASELTIVTTASCTRMPMLAGGMWDPTPIRIIQPNGGEKLFTGSLYFVKWTCPPGFHPVLLDYSTNSGDTWMSITQYGYNFAHNWYVPSTPSTTCLAMAYTRTERLQPLDAALVPAQSSAVQNLVLTPDGAMMAVALADGRVKITVPRTGAPIATLTGHAGGTRALAFSPDATMLATGGNDGFVRVWETATGALTRTIATSAQRVHACAFSDDGRHLAIADENAVDLIRVSDWSRIWRQAGYSSQDAAMIIAPHDAWIATATAKRVALLRFSDGGFLRYLDGHTGNVRALAVSSDGGHLVSGGDDQTILCWDTRTWATDKTLLGHSGAVRSLVLSQYGLQALSASSDKTLRVWDVRGGNTLYTLTGHTDEVAATSYSPGATLIASGGKDKSVRLWGFAMPLADQSDSLWSIVATLSSLQARTSPFDTLVCVSDSSVQTFSITNVGNQPVGLDSVALNGSPGFSWGVPPPLPVILQPGDSITFSVRFLTPQLGPHQATLHFTTNSTAFPALDIPIEGMRQLASITPAPDTVVTAELYHCTIPVTHKAIILNTGTVPVRIDTVVVSDPALLQLQRPPIRMIAPGQRDTVTVTVSPTVFGPFHGNITWHAWPCDLHADVEVSGMYQSTRPAVSRTAIDFGPTSVGDTSYQKLMVRNPTNSLMIINRYSFSAAGFSLLYPTDFSLLLQARDSIEFALAFHPGAEGPASAMLRLISVAPCIDTVDIALTGSSSRKPEINTTLSPFPRLLCPDDRFCDTTLTITNGGGELLAISAIHFSGADSASFSWVPPAPAFPIQLNPGVSRELHLRFTPGHIGTHVATAIVTSNAQSDPRLTLALSGRKDSIGFNLSPPTTSERWYRCELPARHSVRVRNTGTVGIDIGIDTTGFIAGMRLADPARTLSLQAGDSTDLEVVLETPTSGGVSTAILRSRPCPSTQSVQFTDVLQPSAPQISAATIDFGSLGSGTTGRDSVTITNPLADALRIASLRVEPPVSGVAVTLPGGTPLSMAPGTSVPVNVTWSPATDDTLHSTLVIIIDRPCPETLRVALRGNSVSAAATVVLPTLTARVGDVITIPVQLQSARNLAAAGVRSFTATVRARAALLHPLAVHATGDSASFTVTRSGDDLLVHLDVRQSSTPAEGMLADLSCLVLLGDTDRTALHWDTWQWTHGRAATGTTDGSLLITGICEEGGRRFVRPNTAQTIRISPNPFNPLTGIFITVPETGEGTLVVTDARGVEVAMLLRGTIEAGSRVVSFDGSALPSGLYFAVLRTRVGVSTARMMLVK